MSLTSVMQNLVEKCRSSGDQEDEVTVRGVYNEHKFSRSRLEDNRSYISDLLIRVVPSEFFRSHGEGRPFLYARASWEKMGSAENRVPIDTLFCIGVGAGLIRSLTPLDMWPYLPGGMPCYVIELDHRPMGNEPL